MSARKARITVTIDPDLAAYAEQLVETGNAPPVSAVVNDALKADRQVSVGHVGVGVVQFVDRIRQGVKTGFVDRSG